LDILFSIDSGDIDDETIEIIETSGCQYLIKGKECLTLPSQVTAQPISSNNDEVSRESPELITKLNTWDKDRRIVVFCVLKPDKKSENFFFGWQRFRILLFCDQ